MFRFLMGVSAASALTLLCVTGANCAKPGQPPSPRKPVRVALRASTSRPGRIEAALLQSTGVKVEIVEFAGSRASIEGLRRGSTELAVVTSDASYLAFTGQLDESVAPFDKLRGIAVVNMDTLHLMVGKNNPSNSISDLRGSKVSLGPPTSATALVSELLLNAHGLTLDDIKGERLANGEAAKQLITGKVDAAFLPLVAPNAIATEAARGGARLLEIEGPLVEQLRLQHPFLVRTLLPHGTYPGQQKAIRTIGVDLLLVCRADLDDTLVYSFLQAYFAPGTTTATDLDRATAVSIPLHRAASHYYRERELSR